MCGGSTVIFLFNCRKLKSNFLLPVLDRKFSVIPCERSSRWPVRDFTIGWENNSGGREVPLKEGGKRGISQSQLTRQIQLPAITGPVCAQNPARCFQPLLLAMNTHRQRGNRKELRKLKVLTYAEGVQCSQTRRSTSDLLSRLTHWTVAKIIPP